LTLIVVIEQLANIYDALIFDILLFFFTLID